MPSTSTLTVSHHDDNNHNNNNDDVAIASSPVIVSSSSISATHAAATDSAAACSDATVSNTLLDPLLDEEDNELPSNHMELQNFEQRKSEQQTLANNRNRSNKAQQPSPTINDLPSGTLSPTELHSQSFPNLAQFQEETASTAGKRIATTPTAATGTSTEDNSDSQIINSR